jgi:DNA helicase-2/ATP-dependent DNA helicase PcrA
VRDRLDSFLATLNVPQREAVTAPEGPVLVLAGAGSGKTRVLTGRALYLLTRHKASSRGVLVMTFTNKAAGELQNRLRDYLGRSEDLPWAGTFHSFCARLLRIHGQPIGIVPDFSIYDTADTEQVLAGLLAERRVVREEVTPATLRAWISLIKNGGSLSGKNPLHKLAHEILPLYVERLHAAQAVDFDDLLTLPLELFRAHPEILERVQCRYDHVLVDEFQDTNRPQYELARLLASPQDNLFVVGDDDQSIYGWRGADYRNIFDFQKDLSGARVFRLEQNYRSTQPILDVANDIIAGNREREEKVLWTEKKVGEKAVLRQVERPIDEAHEVIGQIHHLQRTQGLGWKDFAVLFRTNALSRPFEEVLVEQLIPYAVVGGVRFYERKEIKDLLAYLRLMVNADDEQAWRRVLRVPPKGIGEATLQQLEQEVRQAAKGIGKVMFGLAEASDLSRMARNKLEPVADMIRSLRRRVEPLDLVNAVEAVLEASGLMKFYGESSDEDGEDRVANLAQLVEAARDRAREHPEYGLGDFLAEAALVSDADEYEGAADRVTLMTMHAAKGLEFPVVFVVAVEEKLLPHQRSAGSVSELEEERRLFYVAVTRARERLYLSYSQTRYINGALEFQEPSRFLRDIQTEHLRGWSLPERQWASSWESEDDSIGSVSPSAPWARHRRPARQNVESLLVPYKIGDVVQHPEFGVGVVTAKSGDLDDLKIRVAFEGFGSKLLAVRFAPLKKVD